jgi:Sec-independent protein translocase protein TatA
LLNSNCNLFGKYNSEFLIDDFSFSLRNNTSEYFNRISSFAVELIDNNRLLNNYFVSRIINNWIDIIFGTRQLPSNHKDLLESCNVYKKVSYEQKTDLEQEIKPFEEKISLNQKNEEEEKKLMKKIEPMIVSMINFGVCPKKILDENVVYDGKIKTDDSIFKSFKYPEDKLIYFNYINEESFILVKDIKKNKIKTRTAISFENKNLKEKESIIYNLKSMNLMKEKNGIKNIQLYQYRYALSTLYLSCNKVKILMVLSCRYFENYFRVQCQDKIINIFYEDFITCIKGRNLFEDDNIFYTGLINGKLTEWEIIPLLDNNIKNKKKVIKCLYNFNIRERKHVYAHKESISVIEIYPKQKILITAGEDKFIYIRKTFDFELLTAIDLTYSFGNPIISKYLNIFPSMIKVSDLNLLFVMVYDYNSKINFIRGYNLNGIFFAQTDQMMF